MKRHITYILICVLIGLTVQAQTNWYQESTWEVVATFSNLVNMMESRDIASIQNMVLGTNVQISTTDRELGREEYGDEINLNFVTNGFHGNILSIRIKHPLLAEIRTITTCVWFQKNTNGQWKITKYLDKPVE